MNKICTLYGFELKKILMRKMVWAAFGIMAVLSIWIPFADLFSTGYFIGGKDYNGYEIMAMYRDAARKLSGRTIDNSLLKEMQDAYRGAETYTEEGAENNIDFSTGMESSFVSAEETGYDENGNENATRTYPPVLACVSELTGNRELALSVNENELYQERRKEIAQTWSDQLLTEDEISYWEEKEKQIEIPLTYTYTGGYSALFRQICPLNYMLLLLVALCLSGVFSMERLRKTEQLILCSQYGKKPLYLAKILAGVTFGTVSALALFLINAAASILLYGADGFHGALQLALPACSRPVSVGTGVLILFAMFLTVGALYSIVTMFLSEWLKNSVAVMAILTGGMIFTMMIDIPYGFRTASQLYDLLPTTLLVEWQLWDDRLVPILGLYLTNFQAAWGIYLIAGGLLAKVGERIYGRI